ncbi:MAG: hypothetical protein HLUCCA11_18885 [Phormidesmis priestleyi Ana]|uniref:Ribbon-helix-helix protein, copG family n=1 Tax=Phormidesmis priestleyi Ana TaxID=1666911 RepID=A0A0P7ZKA4_9CYAN|nr:MAG: hypothetical protein HLUCCA11_18885 [Phormidesmis priestleyi Ana]
MYIETELDSDSTEKLKRIQQQTNQDVAQIIGHALTLYDQQLQPSSHSEETETQSPKKSPLEILQEAGLVGYIKDGDPKLSTNYKTLVHQEIEERHERERQ